MSSSLLPIKTQKSIKDYFYLFMRAIFSLDALRMPWSIKRWLEGGLSNYMDKLWSERLFFIVFVSFDLFSSFSQVLSKIFILSFFFIRNILEIFLPNHHISLRSALLCSALPCLKGYSTTTTKNTHSFLFNNMRP